MKNTKKFKITGNGFIKVTTDGVTINTFFYRTGDEKHYLKEGYEQIS